MLIFANKQDIPGALTKKEIAQVLELDQMEKRHWHIEGCSAVSGEGLLEEFEWCVKDIGEDLHARLSRVPFALRTHIGLHQYHRLHKKSRSFVRSSDVTSRLIVSHDPTTPRP